MTEKTLVIVSGYFSPLHCGHLDYLEAGASLGDRLIVIVNNDLQQKKKKGKVILPQQDRLRIVKALSIVDEACVAIDDDSSVKKTIESIALKNQQFHLNAMGMQLPSCLFHNWKKQNFLQLKLESFQAQV